LDREDWEAAERELSEAIRLNPTDPSYFNNRALVRTAQDNYPAALDDIEQALALDPTSMELAIDKFNLLQAMDRLDEALKWFRRWEIRTDDRAQDLT
jgi:tetratricopeptide (TPR) repeat protein